MTEKGRVFRSEAGRDKGRLMALVSADGAYICVCDGKERPLANPKRKNPRHLTAYDIRLTDSQMRSDRALRKALAVIEADMRTER